MSRKGKRSRPHKYLTSLGLNHAVEQELSSAGPAQNSGGAAGGGGALAEDAGVAGISRPSRRRPSPRHGRRQVDELEPPAGWVSTIVRSPDCAPPLDASTARTVM